MPINARARLALFIGDAGCQKHLECLSGGGNRDATVDFIEQLESDPWPVLHNQGTGAEYGLGVEQP